MTSRIFLGSLFTIFLCSCRDGDSQSQIDSCRLVDVGPFISRGVPISEQHPWTWSVAPNIGIAYHLARYDTWFVTPVGDSREEVPAWAVTPDEIHPLGLEQCGKLLAGRQIDSHTGNVSIRISGSQGQPDGVFDISVDEDRVHAMGHGSVRELSQGLSPRTTR